MFSLGYAKRVICYYTNWGELRPGEGRFSVQDIDPNLCTHIIYSFAKVQGNGLAITEGTDPGSLLVHQLMDTRLLCASREIPTNHCLEAEKPEVESDARRRWMDAWVRTVYTNGSHGPVAKGIRREFVQVHEAVRLRWT